MKLKEGQIMMLPHKAKLFGLGIILLVIVLVVIQRNFSFPFDAEYLALIKDSYLSLLILGLLVIAMSKEEMEDERAKQMKVNAMAGSFIFGGLYAAFTPILNACFGEQILTTTSQGLMLLLLSGHVGMLYGQKFDNWYEERKRKA